MDIIKRIIELIKSSPGKILAAMVSGIIGNFAYAVLLEVWNKLKTFNIYECGVANPIISLFAAVVLVVIILIILSILRRKKNIGSPHSSPVKP